MSAQARTYVKELHDEYEYWPIWTPMKRLKIGDYGTLTNGVFFDKKGHVTKYGVSKQALKTERAQRSDRLRFMTNDAVSFSAQARGENLGIPGIPQGVAGARLDFSREHASFVEATGVAEIQLVDKGLLEEELADLVKSGKFHAYYVVIADLMSASSARVFISTGSGQSITAVAGGGAGATAVGTVSFAVKGSISLQGNVGTEFDGTHGATPLYKPLGFSVGGWMRRSVRRVISRDQVARIAVKAIETQPTVGSRLMVHPVRDQEIAIAPVDEEPLVVEAAALEPFEVDPVMVDADVLRNLVPRFTHDPIGSLPSSVIGSVDSEPTAGAPLIVQPFEYSTVLIQPTDEAPFLGRVVQGQQITLQPRPFASFEPHILPDPLSDIDPDEPLKLDYVDFDAEFSGARNLNNSDLAAQGR
jgi:hypothetical protein